MRAATTAAVAIAEQSSHIPGMRRDPPIVVGISGASGAIYGVRLLEALHDKKIPAHLIVSKSAALTLKEETDVSIDHVRGLAQATYQNTDIGAAISSGSFRNPRHGDRAVFDPHLVRHCLRHD